MAIDRRRGVQMQHPGNLKQISSLAYPNSPEYALWENVSVKAEYLYTDLGSNSVNVVAQKISVAGTAPSSFTATYSALNFNEIRAGLNYKF
jgi:outer membrane immunogenic protein